MDVILVYLSLHKMISLILNNFIQPVFLPQIGQPQLQLGLDTDPT